MGTIKINNTTYGTSVASEIDFNNEVSELEATNVQEAIDKLSSLLPFKLGIDENGNYGYIKDGADTVTPFSNNDPKKLYEALRWIIWIVIPAIGVLLTTLDSAWQWHLPLDAILATMSAISLFLGTVLGISKVANDAKKG